MSRPSDVIEEVTGPMTLGGIAAVNLISSEKSEAPNLLIALILKRKFELSTTDFL
jgi:hypothetical protein